MPEGGFPTHDEVRGLLEKLDEICREAERICTEVHGGLRRSQDATPANRLGPAADEPRRPHR